MLFDPDRIAAIREMICLTPWSSAGRSGQAGPMQQGDFEQLYEAPAAATSTSAS
ncbi:MAG: hypothetical protein ACLRSY_00085 [Acutalibacter sp.]